mgnify:FL=1|jgi:hypothetical protein
MIDIDDFKQEIECIYKDEKYSVRDNGAVFRYPRDGKRPRKYDNFWTFGKANNKHGYMEIASVRVHIIVATAFHGPKPTKEYVVDHIDTNRRNNRPDNLRWVTRLENALNNPITRKRIIMRCGSIEAFLANPSLLRESDVTPDFSWMRTVTDAEAQVSKERLLAWTESDKQVSGGVLGEWVYRPLTIKYSPIEEMPKGPDYVMSLTPEAAQHNWRTPSEFPCTPQEVGDNPLATYAKNLKEGNVFAQNQYGASLIINSGFSEDRRALYVMTESSEGEAAVKPYALARITYEDGLFIHTGHTFFTKEGAEKQFTLAQGLEWIGGDSIDDYC